MPNPNEDLKYTLEVDPDTSKVGAAVADMARDVDSVNQHQPVIKPNIDTSKVDAAVVKMHRDLDDVGKGTKQWEYPESHRDVAGMIQAARNGMKSVGGAVGEMVGGPIGAEVGQMVGEFVGKLQNIVNPARLATAALGQVDSSLKDLGGVLGPIGAGLGVLQSGVSGVGDAVKSIPIIGDIIGPFADAAAAVPGIFKSILESLTHMAAMNSPAEFHLLQVAVADVQATIGRTFVPVLEIMRESIRGVGEVIANVLPNSDEMRGALADMRQSLSDFFRAMTELAVAWGPTIRTVIVGTLTILTGTLIALAKAATLAANTVKPIAEMISGAFGGPGEPRTSVGASVQPASFAAAEEYQRQLQIASYSSGTSGMSSVPSHVAGIHNILSEIMQGLRRMPWWTRIAVGGVPGLALGRGGGNAPEREAAQMAAMGMGGGQNWWDRIQWNWLWGPSMPVGGGD